MRLAGIALAVLILITGILVFALYNLDTLINQNKEYILQQVEKNTGREAEVDKIGLNIFGGLGIQLTNFRLADDPQFSSEYFIKASGLVINVEFLPLLRKELSLKKIILSEPTINVIKNKKGIYNFETIGTTKDSEEKVIETAEANKDKGTKLSIAFIDISDGEVSYTDRESETSISIKKLDMSTENIGTDKPVEIELALALLSDEQNIGFNGYAGPIGKDLSVEHMPLKGEVEITSLDTSKLQKDFPDLKKLIPYDIGLSGPLDAYIAFDGKASSLNFNKVDVSAGIFNSDQQNLVLKGNAGPLGEGFSTDNTTLSIDFELGPVPFEKIRDFKPLAESIPGELSGNGPVYSRGSIKGKLDTISLRSVQFNGTDAELNYGNQFQKPRDMEFNISTDANILKESIKITDARLSVGDLILNAAGEIIPGDTSSVDIGLNTNKGDLKELSGILPSLKQYEASGKFELNTDIKGKYGKNDFPEIKGTARLENTALTLPQLEKPLSDINSVINFTGNNANIKETSATMGRSRIVLSAKVTSFSPLTMEYKITSPVIYLSDITPDREGELKDLSIDGTMSSGEGSNDIRADLRSDSGKISRIGYSDMNGEINMKNDVINFNDIFFRLLNGSMKANGYYDMSQTTPSFIFNTSVQGLNITNLIKTLFTSESEHIEGMTNLSLNISGKGSTWEQISNSLNGLGNIELTEGRLTDFNLAEEVLTGLTGIQGLSNLISSEIENKYPEIFKNSSTVFYNMKTPLKIVNGRINFNELLLRSSDYLVKGDGWLSINKDVEASGFLTLAENLSKDLTSRIELVKYLNDEQGRVRIPFRIDGSLPGIKPQPDLSSVADILSKAAVDKGKEQIRKKIFDELKQDGEKGKQGATNKATKSPEKELEEKIRSLIPFPPARKSDDSGSQNRETDENLEQ